MTVFTVVDPVFKTEPLFIIGCSHRQLGAYLRKRFRVDAGEDGGQCGQMFTFPQRTVPLRVVWVQRRDLAVALHELFHLVTRICEDLGIPIRAHIESGECADEPAAYLFEFFARVLLRRLR